MSRPLPQPTSERWQPLRAGLVDVFYYDQEEFWFRDGRLLLRGNNGTGKSKVLALMLPFLLDGELSPHRVEPDADPKKRMEWNLLLGGEHPNSERLGYTWLEFGRRERNGTPVYCTLGCGLKAVSGRGIASNWFFVTRQRVGRELALADAAGIALTRERLEEALATEGAVHRTATAYRRAVDETLFGLGELRYGALVDLLIRIRAPQLSKRPSERALSDALTEALTPLDQALIADVADAFRSLEEDRGALAAMVEARDAAATYLQTYRRYAQIACRRRAARPRQAQSVYDRVSRERAEAQAAHEHAATELAAAHHALAELREQETRLRARDRALRESPEARSAQELEGAEREARMAAEHADEARKQHRRAAERVEELDAQEAEAVTRRDEATATMQAIRVVATEAARTALVSTQYADRIDSAIGAEPVADVRRAAAVLLDRQAQAVAHLRRLLETLSARQADVARARERLDELIAEHDALAERRQTVVTHLRAAAAALVSDAREHLAGAPTLAVADPATVLAALELWVETLDGPNPLRAAVDAASRVASTALARAEALAQARRADAQALVAELEAEIERLEAGVHDTPPVPYTRAAEDRAQRPGAPFWQLVDFREALAPGQRAGIEAALEAAGILDAWVTGDGTLLDPASDDVLVEPLGARIASEHLGAVLLPAIDHDDPRAGKVSEAAVQRLLEAIGLGVSDGPVWIAASGEFRNGVLHGRWRKPAAAFVGRGAREAASRARVTELRARLERQREQLSDIAVEQERIRDARAGLDAELAATPGDEPLRDRHAALVALDDERRRSDERCVGVRERLQAATAAAAAAEHAALDGADELRLPVDPGELGAVSQGLADLRTALAELWPSLLEHERAQTALQRAAEQRLRAQAEAAERSARTAGLQREAAQFSERHRVLAQTVGAAVAELQERLALVDKQLRRNEHDCQQAEQRRAAAQREEGKEAGRLEQLAAELEQAGEQRRHDVAALGRFASTGLVGVALPQLELPTAEDEWTVTAALRVARQIEQELSGVVDDDEQAWVRAQRRATDELGALADALRRHGNNASARLQEEGIMVEVVFRGRSATVPALVAALAVEVEDRERLLDEREREILENHLVNEVASSLQELISAAEAQVLAMNAELAERPTSTGMRLRMLWRTAEDGPQGLAVARERLLRQHADAWSEEDRAAVGTFLQAQIQDVRARDGAGTWLEHLTEALDYRAWHRFTIQRHQAGQWRSATGPASGGERVLAASVPLFAAASAHYASASNPHAPRLVMLDEAFAGVDDDSRAKCLGLLTAFDLDVVMTSEREWGCYPEVPGLAIAQLSRVDGVAAVLVTHWEWDGAARRSVDRPRSTESAPISAAPDQRPGQEDLWIAPATSA
jgi:uncharacterized protein (TIGR02680 family)